MGKKIASVAPKALIAKSPLGLPGLLAPKIMDKLGIGLEDEQGAYNDQADLQAYLRSTSDSVDPTKGMDMATKYVQGNDLTKGLFGEDGLQSQLATEGKNLASNGFSLTQGDREAYGQAAGDISRLAGQEEQGLMKSLQSRGLASAGSGAAGAGFSGVAGNKFERLAKAQSGLADRRMENAQNRLVQNRTMQSQLAGQGMSMAGNQFTNQVNARSNRIGELKGISDSQTEVLRAQQAAVKPGLFSTIGQGLQAGIGNLATQAPGMIATGGMPMGGAASAGAPAAGPGATSQFEQQNGYSNADWGGKSGRR